MARTRVMRLLSIAGGLAAALAVAGVIVASGAARSPSKPGFPISAHLSGFREVPPILTNGEASFRAIVRSDSISYTLTFSGLTSNATQAHLHFGEPGVNGGIFVFLCTNLGNGPAGTPACPAACGTVSGTLTAANVVSIAAQNVTSGDFAAVRRIIASGDAYANIHTVNFPAGEIRGQVHFR
jgi:hypothetical protein